MKIEPIIFKNEDLSEEYFESKKVIDFRADMFSLNNSFYQNILDLDFECKELLRLYFKEYLHLTFGKEHFSVFRLTNGFVPYWLFKINNIEFVGSPEWVGILGIYGDNNFQNEEINEAVSFFYLSFINYLKTIITKEENEAFDYLLKSPSFKKIKSQFNTVHF